MILLVTTEITWPSSNKDLFIHQLKEDNKLDGIEHWMPLFYKKKFISFLIFLIQNILYLSITY